MVATRLGERVQKEDGGPRGSMLLSQSGNVKLDMCVDLDSVSEITQARDDDMIQRS